MNLLSAWLQYPFVQESPKALEVLHNFDADECEASILLILPIEVLQDQRLTNRITTILINKKIEALVVAAILQEKGQE